MIFLSEKELDDLISDTLNPDTWFRAAEFQERKDLIKKAIILNSKKSFNMESVANIYVTKSDLEYVTSSECDGKLFMTVSKTFDQNASDEIMQISINRMNSITNSSEEWLPIETAPVGEVIRVIIDGDHPVTGMRFIDDFAIISEDRTQIKSVRTNLIYTFKTWPITHWKAVPKLKCPVCGKSLDLTDEDVLHKSATFARHHSSGRVSYVSRMDSRQTDVQCWELHCPEHYGGCGMNITGDSRDELIDLIQNGKKSS